MPAAAVIDLIVRVINVVIQHHDCVRLPLDPGARPINVTHASGQCYQEHGTPHESGFVGFEKKFFIIHSINKNNP
jgi:hypothetical protein